MSWNSIQLGNLTFPKPTNQPFRCLLLFLPLVDSWWFFTDPSEKFAKVKLDHFSQGSGVKFKKSLKPQASEYFAPENESTLTNNIGSLVDCIPSLKLTASSPLKIDGWKTIPVVKYMRPTQHNAWIFPTKYGIPKSLKPVSHWLSKPFFTGLL